MIRARLTAPAVLLAVALAVAGCGADDNTTPTAAPTTPAATSAAPVTSAAGTAENDRWACRQIVEAGTDFSPGANLGPAEIAAASSNPGIAKAGRELRTAALDSQNNPSVSANIAVAETQLALAKACGSLFGDGPW